MLLGLNFEVDDPVWLLGFVDDMIKAFDTFLWVNQVDLGNGEKKTEEEENDDCVIYGSDYEVLFKDVYDTIARYVEI